MRYQASFYAGRSCQVIHFCSVKRKVDFQIVKNKYGKMEIAREESDKSVEVGNEC